jgi:hypothetical protein
MKKFDTEEGILEYLSRGLEGLNDLIKDRYEDGYKNHDLHCWIFGGCYYSDECGNTGIAYDYEDNIITFPLDVVISSSDMKKFNIGITTNFQPPPKVDDTCCVCGKKWTLKDCPTYTREFKNDGSCENYHSDCHQIKIDQNERKIFDKLLTDAGFVIFSMNEIPNGYYSSKRYQTPPWFQVKVPGAIFKMGWRKSVISIEIISGWKMPENIINELNAKNITVWETGCHAWSLAEAIDLLGRIRKANMGA